MPRSAPLPGLLSSLCFGKQTYKGTVDVRMQMARVTALGSWDSPAVALAMGDGPRSTFSWLSLCSINGNASLVELNQWVLALITANKTTNIPHASENEQKLPTGLSNTKGERRTG